MLIRLLSKFLLLVVLIFSNCSVYAENNKNKKLSDLDSKINNLNQIIELEMKNISKAVESNESVEEIQKKIESLSVLIDINVKYIETQMEIQKKIDILSSPLIDELNQLLINRNIEICNKYSFVKGTASFEKCLLNLMNAFEAITDTKIESHPIADKFADKVRKEAKTVWKAAGIEWDPMNEYYSRSTSTRSIEQMPKGYNKTGKKSSTWQSLTKKNGNAETEQINGDIVDMGRMVGIKTPYNEVLTNIIKEMIKKKEMPGKYSFKDLEKKCSEQENYTELK